MTPDEFDAAFDNFQVSAFRMECRQTYAVDEEDAALRAFRERLPRPERSVRTDPWLRRIATTTVAGRSWSRLRLIKHPLSEYVRWEMIAYAESAVAGEEIRLLNLDQYPELSDLGPDFWYFGADNPDEFAIVMHYPPDGSLPTYERITDVRWCRDQRDAALSRSVSLAEYLATQGC